MTNAEIAAALDEIAQLLLLQDEKPFRANAYALAARRIEGLPTPVPPLVKEGRLSELDGIGPAIAEKISTLVLTGRLPYLEQLRASIPPGVVELSRIQGLGPRKIRTLWKEGGIESPDDLERALKEGRLKGLRGFGPRVLASLERSLNELRSYSGAFLLGSAWKEGENLLHRLREVFHVKQCEIVGATRRGLETVTGLDLLAASETPDALAEAFPEARTESAGGILRLVGTSPSGIPLTIHIVSPDRFALAQIWLTADEPHRKALLERLNGKGLKIRDLRLFRDGHPVAVDTPEQVYRHAGLPCIPPELREGSDLSAPPRLVEREDLRGVLHVHSSWSDGVHPLEEMIRGAESLGYSYVGITEHSKTAAYAGGLTEARLREQAEALDRIRRKIPGIRILHGTECDILPDGSMDFPDSVLRRLDFVIASVHSAFNMPRDRMTERICRALRHPYVDLLGHPTGRLLLHRPGYEVDLDAVIACARDEAKAIELNANPRRLDLDSGWARRAVRQGVRLSINPDAHSRAGLEDVNYGVRVARRAGLEPKDVLNTRTAEEIAEIFGARRR